MTQREMILNHLRAHDTITPLEALSTYGVYRLSSIINRLRHAGHDIETETMTGTGMNGNPLNYARYRLRH